MNGIILTNPYFNNQSAAMQATRLKEEFSRQGMNVPVVRNEDIMSYVERASTVTLDRERLDFAVYLDKDKYQAPLLERAGVRLFNSARAIALCDDKMETAIALSGSGIRLPRTLPAPLCFTREAQVSSLTLDRIERLLGYPLIVKESYGSLGEEVTLVRDRDALERVSDELKMRPHLYQEAVTSSFGRDIRVIVIGGEVVAAMARENAKDFRANIAQGGTGHPTKLSASYEEMAIHACSVLGLDYAGVDILHGEDDEPVLCEVNSNAFFRGMESATGVNIAARYVTHILHALSLKKPE